MTSIFRIITNKLMAANDGTFDRAAMGNLDAYTDPTGRISPAHYGFRALDAVGNLIFDSNGVASNQILRFVGIVYPSDTTVVTTSRDIVGASVPFSVPNRSLLLAFYGVAGSQTVTAGVTGMLVDGATPLAPDGSVTGFNMSGLLWDVSGVSTNGLGMLISSVQPGSHTVNVYGNSAGGGTLTLKGMFVAAFVVGT